MKLIKTTLIVTAIFCLSGTSSLAQNNTLAGNNSIEGVIIRTNDDSSNNGEGFFVIDGNNFKHRKWHDYKFI